MDVDISLDTMYI